VIVSGLARGIDAVCHEGALSVGGKTIAVLGHGCDLVYPKQNSDLFARIASEGLLISEYEDGTSPLGCHQLIREGAHLLDSVGDLYRELPRLFTGLALDVPPERDSLITSSDASHQILSLLSGGPLVLASLKEAFDGPFDTLLETLHALEVQGLIARAGLFYHLKIGS